MVPKTVFSNEESTDELKKIKELEKKVDREKLLNETKTDTYDFRIFRTIRTFGKDIHNRKITLEEANESQAKLTEEIYEFMNKTRPKSKKRKRKKKLLVKTCIISIMAEKWFLILLQVKYFKKVRRLRYFKQWPF